MKQKNNPKDYVAIALEYAQEVVANKRKVHGHWIKQAGKRFFSDIKRANKKKGAAPFIFSPTHANHVCQFIEYLPHIEGV